MRVKLQKNKRSEENIGHIVIGKRAMTVWLSNTSSFIEGSIKNYITINIYFN